MIFTSSQIISQKRLIENELDKRIKLMKENLVERGKNIITTLSQQVEKDIASFNFSGMMEDVKEGIKGNEEIKYAILTDASGTVFVHTLNPDLMRTKLTEERDKAAAKKTAIATMEYQEADGPVIEIVKPVQISTNPWGVLRLVFTLEHFDAEIKSSKKQIQWETKRMIRNAILTSLIFMGVCFLIVLLLSTRFSTPLIHLTDSARKLSQGDFTHAVQVSRKNEIGVLGEAMNHMVANLSGIIRKIHCPSEITRTFRQIFP
ncbi:MAG: hypothetical protein B6245_23015 [Desulfobacteraceae bacterium 4572_88]|nr:MAG: hypothetical protein B6245_23015 [Desulfobacteraceae bacterium 4572_88]